MRDLEILAVALLVAALAVDAGKEIVQAQLVVLRVALEGLDLLFDVGLCLVVQLIAGLLCLLIDGKRGGRILLRDVDQQVGPCCVIGRSVVFDIAQIVRAEAKQPQIAHALGRDLLLVERDGAVDAQIGLIAADVVDQRGVIIVEILHGEVIVADRQDGRVALRCTVRKHAAENQNRHGDDHNGIDPALGKLFLCLRRCGRLLYLNALFSFTGSAHFEHTSFIRFSDYTERITWSIIQRNA